MKVNPIPEDCNAVIPYLTVPDPGAEIEFLKQAFGATERGAVKRPDGSVMHGEVKIRDSVVMVGGARGEWKARPNTLYVYVADVDATYKKALAAGAKSVTEPADMFYGDRHACVRDAAENDWWIASRIENVALDEIQRRATEFVKNMEKKTA